MICGVEIRRERCDRIIEQGSGAEVGCACVGEHDASDRVDGARGLLLERTAEAGDVDFTGRRGADLMQGIRLLERTACDSQMGERRYPENCVIQWRCGRD